MNTSHNKILAIIPAYNEAESLSRLIPQIRFAAPDWDIVVVDDGSHDDTASVAWGLGATLLQLPFNLGIGGAVQAGLIYACRHNYDICLQIDGDGQHDPAESVRLVQALLVTGADAVNGSRFMRQEGFQSTFSRRLGIRILRIAIRLLTGEVISDPTSGQRAFGRRAISLLARSYPQEYPEPEVICTLRRNGLHLVELPVKMYARPAGQSSIRRFHSVLYMCKVLISICITPSRRRLPSRNPTHD